MLLLFYFLILSLAIHVAGQESVEFLTIPDHSIPVSHTAALVPNEHLKEISSSVLMAESWTRTHVLAHYPGINITTIVVGHTLLCEKDQEEKLSLILPSLKNIHYTLTRWGLHKEIKVSASFSSSCLHSDSGTFRSDIAEIYIKPLLSFLNEINSPYLVKPPSHSPTLSEKNKILLNSHLEALKNLGFFNLNKIHVVVFKGTKEPNPTSRKLSFILDTKITEPLPARPTPLAPANAPTYAAGSPLPPWLGKVSPPPFSMPPLINHPANPPYGFHLPPCNPSGGPVAAAPVTSGRRGLWCVAKPSVPPETLQQALDYACGQGGGDCTAIRPRGSCYYPNTVVAHASYAFNSYWQKSKMNGGTCGFGGTAMLIDSDPSYRHCRFTLAQ
ncbi:hypothetical protein ACH5RR_011531 [Cinchona calisaya]|uniref:X8 domain-containing protein n=1 Tax=Cinchona calisaya TaxID=153742 RepID=A0ABD3A8R8_9GENT